MGMKIHNRIRSSDKVSLRVVVYRLTLRVQCRNGLDFWPGTGRAAVTPYTDQCHFPALPEGLEARTVLPSASTAQSIVASFSVSQSVRFRCLLAIDSASLGDQCPTFLDNVVVSS